MGFYFVDVLSIFFEALIIYTFFNTIGIKKDNKWLILCNYASFIFVLSVLYWFIDIVWIKLFVLFIYMFVLSLAHNINNRFRWISILILFVVINVIEMLVGFLMSAIFSMTVSAIRDTILYYAVGVLASKSLTLLFVKLIQFKNKTNSIKISKSIIVLYSVFPIITLVVGIILIGGFGADIDPMYSVFGVIAEALLVIANISVFHLFEIYASKTNKEFEIELENSQLVLQRQYLEDKIEKQTLSAKEMHDLKNQLFAIRQLLNENVDKGLKKIDDICQVVTGMQNIIYTSNESLDALINSKKHLIDINDIDFKCECFISGFEGINIIDLCILLGNLLDNSIEACLKLDSNRMIQLNFRQVDNYINITIKNTFKNEGNEDYSTTKENKFAHGHGLNSVAAIVNKNNGFIDIQKNEVFLLFLYYLKILNECLLCNILCILCKFN